MKLTKHLFRNIRKGTKIPKKCIEKSIEALSKPVKQYSLDGDFIKKYNSVTEAGLQFNRLGQKNISKCLSGAQSTAYGYKWAYDNKNKKEEKIFKNRYLHLFITRYNTICVKFRVNGEAFYLGTFDTQKEALLIKNKFIEDNNLEHFIKIEKYIGE